MRYLLFTDLKDAPAPWEVHRLEADATVNLRRLSRVVKIQPDVYLPKHEISIYMDANLRLTGKPLVPLAEEFLVDNVDIAIPGHVRRPGRLREFSHKCLYAEGEVCRRLGLDEPDVIQRQMERYRAMGFPEEFGLLENCFIMRRNTRDSRLINRMWAREYREGSARDQLSLMFCLWWLGLRFNRMDIHARSNEYYVQVSHLKPRRVC